MTRISILLGGIAMVAASACHAQLLGGGNIGGGGSGIGSLTGSLGGGIGGMTGRLDGDVQGSLRSQQLREAAHIDRVRVRELRAQEKAARRNSANPANNRAMADTAMPIAATGRGSGSIGSAPLASAGSFQGSTAVTDTRAIDVVRGRTFAARAEAEASRRGLDRVGRSAGGVAVYVPVPVATGHTLYRGGGTYLHAGGNYGSGYFGDGYFGGGRVSAPPVQADETQYRELQRDTAGTGITIEQRGADLIMELPADVTFAFDRADIQPRFVSALDAVARTIAAYPATEVEVIGHTDGVGSDAYNFGLSQRRGASVADFLVSRHTDPERLVVEGLGKTEPVASNATITGRAANRRVEIVLHGHSV